jgi:hypothetical protein
MEHRAAGCCERIGVAWQGTADVEEGELALRIAAGEETAQNSCHPAGGQRRAVAPHVETIDWTLRRDAQRGDRPLLCWTPHGGKMTCMLRE